MKPKAMITMYCAMIICALTGCQLAQEEAATNTYEDKLVGFLVTKEHLDLFDFESYLNDNLNALSGGEITIDGNTQKYQGRLYATLTSRTLTSEETGESFEIMEYIFEDIEGFPFFSPTMHGEGEGVRCIDFATDEAISEGHNDVYIGDDENSRTLKGTIYVSPAGSGIFYFNPVFQSMDGSVYATSGNGMSVSGVDSEGAIMSQTMEDTYSITENEKTKTDSISITLSVSFMLPPEKIVILQMDEDSRLLSRTEYAPDALPEAFTPEPDAAYLVVETHKTDAAGGAAVSRGIYGRENDSIETFFARTDGICIKHWSQIMWP